MSTTLITEQFNGTPIVFRGDAWVNATQMAKPFGKRPVKFLELPSTKQFIAALSNELGVMSENRTSLFETIRGRHADGRQQGTWMHPDLAMEFARWLSPEFAIWTNRVIRRLLSGGGSPDLGQFAGMFTSVMRAHAAVMERQTQRMDEILLALRERSQPVPVATPVAAKGRGGFQAAKSVRERAVIDTANLLRLAGECPGLRDPALRDLAHERFGIPPATFYLHIRHMRGAGLLKPRAA